MPDYPTILTQLHDSLNILLEREAKYSDNAPLDLLNQIDDHRAAIALTGQARAGEIGEAEWRESLRPLLVDIRDQTERHPEWGVSIGNVDGGIIGAIIAGRDVIAGGDIVSTPPATGDVSCTSIGEWLFPPGLFVV